MGVALTTVIDEAILIATGISFVYYEIGKVGRHIMISQVL